MTQPILDNQFPAQLPWLHWSDNDFFKKAQWLEFNKNVFLITISMPLKIDDGFVSFI